MRAQVIFLLCVATCCSMLPSVLSFTIPISLPGLPFSIPLNPLTIINAVIDTGLDCINKYGVKVRNFLDKTIGPGNSTVAPPLTTKLPKIGK